MLRMKKAIVICREVNRQTGQIAVYVVPMEIDEHTVVRLSLRSMFNPELRYFFVYEDVYQEQKQEITAIFKSITFDNGTEFAAAEELERSCINKHLPRTKVYFCHPYSSWERGTNENTNGMIRRRFPKGTNFAAVTNAQITQAENWINNYPRKILGYKSSEIVFRECLRELGIAA